MFMMMLTSRTYGLLTNVLSDILTDVEYSACVVLFVCVCDCGAPAESCLSGGQIYCHIALTSQL